ncbi:MAG: aldo/keto reductase [Leptospirales bacterium]|nr:aldo/keto reductase [Leptospirales bacterium]
MVDQKTQFLSLLPGRPVPRIWFGAWAIGGWHWGGPNDTASQQALLHAFEQGITAVDTAPIYGFGHSETLIGKALRALPFDLRKQAFIATKFGLRWNGSGTPFFDTQHQGSSIHVTRNLSKVSILEECDASLRRLDIEAIDLYQVHWPEPGRPLEEVASAVETLLAQGKILAFGFCNWSVENLIDWNKISRFRPTAIQEKFSLLNRKIETGLLQYTVKHQIPVLAYGTMAQGLLAGAVPVERVFEASDGRSRSRAFESGMRMKIREALDSLTDIAEKYRCSAAELAVAFALCTAGISAALVGLRTLTQVDAINRAAQIPLEPGDYTRIRRTFEPLQFHGH